MSLFSKTEIPQTSGEKITQVAVSNVLHNPSIAITTPNKILLYNESGEKHDYELSRNITPSFIEWHPNQPTIAIGWENGTLTLWNEESKLAKEETNGHKEAITLIAFNPSGSRMVTADKTGIVSVWRGISKISSYKKEGIITHCIFCELNIESKLTRKNLFFFGGKSGIVCLADDSNHCSDVCKVGGAIKSLLFYEKENSVIIITSTLLLVQFKISTQERSGPDKKVKLSIAGDPQKLSSIWIGTCLLATCSHENMLRMWHLEADENYVLTLHDIQSADDEQPQQSIMTDKLTCIDYEKKGKVLVSGTKEGKLIFWKNLAVGSESPLDTDQWKPLPYIQLEKDSVNKIAIGQNNGLIGVLYGNQVCVVQETVIKGRMSNTLKLLQTSANKVQIYFKNEVTDQMFLYDSKENNIKGLDCSDTYMLIWSNKKIEIHEILYTTKQASHKLIGVINEKCLRIGMFNDSIILANEYGINVSNLKGVIKQNLNFSESEGKLQNMNINSSKMVMWTNNNYLRIFDLSRREYKQIGLTRKFEDSTGSLGTLRQCAINSDGTKVVIVADQKKNNTASADHKVYIYDVDMDNFIDFDCGQDRVPLEAFWDRNDKKFFGVLCNISKIEASQEGQKVDHTRPVEFKKEENEEEDQIEKGNLELMTFFCTTENGIKKQDTYPMEKQFEGVFAISIPFLYFIKRNPTNDPTSNYKIQEKQMNDFVGLEKIDDTIKDAIMNFSFFLSTGNLDEAYKSVKSIQNPAVWEKMAQMCVKTKRLDVAEICLGNMRFARGAKAVRESKKEQELDAQLAMVAIQLGMVNEAQKLYENSKRFDLLNKMYQAEGDWEKAIQIAEQHDRINLKSTYFRVAKMFEVSKDYDQAIDFYEKAGCHVKEVPRMLLEADELDLLEKYIEEKREPELYKWWAQYLESSNEFEEALIAYKKGEDWASVVRILCHQQDFNGAKQICRDHNDPAACYFLAKQLEMKNAINEAIQYYAKAQYFTRAVKLARERGMDSEVMSLSLQGPQQVMLQSGAYFEDKGFIDKAVQLYKKGGNLRKAYDMAQKANLKEEMEKIAQMMEHDNDQADHLVADSSTNQFNYNAPTSQSSSEDPESQIENFIKKGQPERAIPLLINLKQYERALEYFSQYNIPLADEFVKKIIPEEPPQNAQEEKRRKDLMNMIAECAKKQGNLQLASSYYIKLGEQIKAIKCLINLGATDKIITFATIAKNPQTYILAGNFLQTSDWHKNPELMRHIINFYNKAKAYDHLAGFFDACASVEIDEYRDYQKATAALKEAMKHAQRSTQNQEDKDQRIQALQQKIFLIEKFLQAKAMTETDPKGMLDNCHQLLENPNLEVALRAGDVYAHIIEFFYDKGDMQNAFEHVKKMKDKGIIIAPYLDQEMLIKMNKKLQNIFDAVGVKNYKHQQSAVNEEQQQSDQHFEEEEVVDEDVGNY